MNLTEAAAFLSVSPRSVRLAVERGVIAAEHPLPDGPWIFQRQGLESAAAHAFVHLRLTCAGRKRMVTRKNRIKIGDSGE